LTGEQADNCKVYGTALRGHLCKHAVGRINLPFRLWPRVGRRCTNSIVFARWCQCALMGEHVAVTVE